MSAWATSSIKDAKYAKLVIGSRGCPFNMATYLRALPNQLARRSRSRSTPRRRRFSASFSSAAVNTERTHAGFKKSLSHLPDEVGFHIGRRSAGLLRIRPEPISDFDPIAAPFAYLMQLQLAKTGFDRLPILAQD